MSLKIGILGGGQLGQMFLQNAYSYPFQVHILDEISASCARVTPFFHQGNIRDFQEVYNFGKFMDIVSIEIENVSIEALKRLECEGIKVFPEPRVLELIADKCSQKQFFKENHLPTADFVILENSQELTKYLDFLPAFQKLAKGGYDGRGVQLLANQQDLHKAFQGKSLLEKKVNVQKEISVIVARNKYGTAVYEPVEMVFDKNLHLVDYLLAPARISPQKTQEAQNLAIRVIEKLQMTGILAVEMFLDENDNLLINELAPRPHNSGHHTIEAAFCSQYDQHLRAIAELPLGNPTLHTKAGMLNILGEKDYEGYPLYEGLADVLALPKVYLHLYNKTQTKKGRKMGHFTILGESFEEIEAKIAILKQKFKVKARPSNIFD
ncbi:MAG: 5-(carboxyamino)imidazole ribonucleotide synthase [Raineya sp.]|nr:5-(carboxyamino)imidazole ribonucleotide synthase [Raineya sp.]MDW8296644.1 5-(carboxyamino)imidazole ribonucleotide synthase [Raineya sp.]